MTRQRRHWIESIKTTILSVMKTRPFSLDRSRLASCIFAAILFVSLGSRAGASDVPFFRIPSGIKKILQSRCVDCHSGDAAEAGIDFDSFDQLKPSVQAHFLNQVQDQVFFRLMPPEDAEPLSESERSSLALWLSVELRRRGVSKLHEKLRHPAFGNYVDHTRAVQRRNQHAQLLHRLVVGWSVRRSFMSESTMSFS